MKILLCTPFSTSPEVTQGGITIWARNMMEYYQKIDTDVQVEVVPFDRKRRDRGLFNRICGGITDYNKAITNVKKILDNSQYDVLHLCTSASLSLVKDIRVLKMARKHSVKTIIHFHFGRIPELAEQNNWEWKLLKNVLKLANEIITIDLKSYESLKKQGYQNIYYLPNPLSNKIIRQIENESNNIERDLKKICFVGHVIPSKGVYEMCNACANIKGIKLYVIGKVTKEVRTKMLQLTGNSETIVFEEEIAHEDVIRELLSSGIFVLPSYTEGFPNVILEAMACGCAIATTKVGAIPEMLNVDSDAPCGLCCDPKDVEGLHKNIQFYLEHPTKIKTFTGRAIKRVNGMYAVPIVWKQLEEIWEK